MTMQEVIHQLESLILDCESFITENGDDDDFKRDRDALQIAVRVLKSQERSDKK